jgi:ParB/RepB/Spo0J family partition protein
VSEETIGLSEPEALEMPGAEHPPLDVRDVPLEQIAEIDNIRPAYHGIEGLAQTMHLEGQLQPCLVRPAIDRSHGRPFELIFGYRRKRAAEHLREQGISGWETLRCEVREVPDDEQLAKTIIENFQRETLSPIAEARAMEAIKYSAEPPLSNVRVARMLGCDPSQVSHRLKLLTLAPEPEPAETEKKKSATEKAAGQHDILELVDKGEISASTAEVIASLDQEEERQKLVGLVRRHDWGVKKAANWARQVKDHKLEEGTDEMGPVEMLEAADAVALPQLRVRPDLSPAQLSRLTLYVLLRNGMDQEMLDYLAEELGYEYERLWDYVTSLSDSEVSELTERQLRRYIGAAHRWFDLEAELKDEFGLPEEAADAEQSTAAEQAALRIEESD